MEFNKQSTDLIQYNVNINEKLIGSETLETFNYLYPNGNCISHQIIWFKRSRDRGFTTNIAV